MSNRPRIAAIITEYRPRSHADVIIGKFLQGFPTDEGLIAPRVDMAAIYIDQFPENDIGRAMAETYNVPIYWRPTGDRSVGDTLKPLPSSKIFDETRRS